MAHKLLSYEELKASILASDLMRVMGEEPPLPCVLIGVAALEQGLATLLNKYFIKGGTAKEVFRYDRGILGTYSSRFTLAYCLGLITSEMMQDFRLLGEVRNAFAHSHVSRTFDDPEISELCSKLTVPAFRFEDGTIVKPGADSEHNLKDPRVRFVWLVLVLAVHLLQTAEKTEQKQPCKEGIEFP